jgi:hypothetical protein
VVRAYDSLLKKEKHKYQKVLQMASAIAALRHASAQTNNNSPDELYYTGSWYNSPTLSLNDATVFSATTNPMDFTESVNVPFLQRPLEYMVAVDQVRIPALALAQATTSLTTQLTCAIGYSQNAQTSDVKLDNTGVAWFPRVLPYQADGIIQNPGASQVFLLSLNTALAGAFEDLKVVFPAFEGVSPPFVSWSQLTGFYTLYAEKGIYWPNYSGVGAGIIAFSFKLRNELALPTYSLTAQIDTQQPTLLNWGIARVMDLNINQQEDVVVTHPSTYEAVTCVTMQGKQSAATQASLYRRIQIWAPTMLVTPSFESSVGQEGSTIEQQNVANAQRVPVPVLFEYTLMWPVWGWTIADFVFNAAQGARQWRNLTGYTALTSLRFQFWGIDAANNARLLDMSAGDSCSMTIVFRRKTVGTS